MTQPPFLCAGDTVGVVAPASRFLYEDILPGLTILQDNWQLTVVEGESLKARHGSFAGTDDLRRADLQRMLDDPAIKAIFAARGGYGCTRLVDQLDFTQFMKHPKWLIGFSDITVLHCHLHQLGVESLHAIMPKLFGSEEVAESVETLRKWVFGEIISAYRTPPHLLNRTGQATGPVVGGNLTLLTHVIGSSSDISLNGKILFIEDIEEYLHNLDRMLRQLRRAGRLDTLAGLLVGQFTDMKDNPSLPYEQSPYEIVAEVVADYDFPVCYDFPVGHVARNLALPIGHDAMLEVTGEGGVLSFTRAETII
ncbi:LD-carboxypeptidase [Nibrella saemangeumensis]|uniref:LD-carboxypeptidase n=1 Tax=Nibrella saemangeumensis TaxID=1084526 RepID=A0ABP8MND2_9BACT